MIQIHTFRAPLDGKDFEDVAFHISQRVGRMIPYRLELLGANCEQVEDVLELRIRVQGLDRWRIRQHAREFGTFLLGIQGLKFQKPLQPYSVDTEGNRRGLSLDEGRTPRDRPRNGQGRRHSGRSHSDGTPNP